MDGRATLLLERFGRAQGRQNPALSDLRDAYRFCLPQHPWGRETAPNAARPPAPAPVLNSVGVEGLQGYAGRIRKLAVPPTERWLAFKAGAGFEGRGEAVKRRVDQALELLAEVFFEALDRSNFQREMGRALLDYGVSTGALLMHEGVDPRRPFDFEAVPLWALVLEEGAFGRPGGVWREWKILARNIPATWPDVLGLPELRIDQEPDRECTLVEGCLPHRAGAGHEYMVIDRSAGRLLVERRYRTSPWLVFRNVLSAGEVLGRGPALRALDDLRQLSKVEELTLRSAAQRAMPAYTVDDDGVVQPGSIELAPGMLIPKAPGSAGIQPIPPAGDPQLAELKRGEIIQRIQRTFLADALPPSAGPVRSATEIAERVDELRERTEPSATQLDSELLVPLAERGLDILGRKGVVPPGLLEGGLVRVEVQNPLARLRRASEGLRALEHVQTLIATVGPEAVAARVDLGGLSAWVAERLGLPMAYVLDDDEAAERAEAQRQAQMQAMMMQAALQPGGEDAPAPAGLLMGPGR